MSGSHGVGPIAVGYRATSFEVFARGGDGTLAVASETNMPAAWPIFASWDALRPRLGTTVGTWHDSDGRPVVSCTREDGHVLVRSLDGANWQPWFDLGGDAAGTPSITANSDGRLEIFVRGANGQLEHRWHPW